MTRLPGAMRAIEHASLWIERPVRRASGSSRLNPLPHAGTISVFLLGVVVVSGLYVTLFYEFGYAASYDSVAAMEDHAIQRVVRALHRYSSAMLVVTTIVHAWRVFAGRRFTGRRRRWTWATGVSSLVLVWLAGVTGYWLVWDRRAAAINEVTARLLRSFDAGTEFAIRHLVGVSPGSGSNLLLFIWFVHLGLTAVIGWFMYRHLRRSTQPWLPPRHWMVAMGGGLVAVSALVPVGMLGPARPDQLVASMPLDPFVLFLLPPLLTGYDQLAAAIAVAIVAGLLVLPRVLARGDDTVVVIDADACTGCALCVADCPYHALEMTTPAVDARPVAVLDPRQCVACGICVGSCAFDAIELPGWTSTTPDVSGTHVVVACDRHLRHGDLDLGDDHSIVPVRCAGMFEPNAVRAFVERGALDVQLIGCAPDDCRFGVGNRLAQERLRSERSPHPPRRFVERIAADWIDPDQVVGAVARPGSTAGDAGANRPIRASIVSGAGIVVALSIAGVVFATRAPFRRDDGVGGVRVVVDHSAGERLQEIERSFGAIEWIDLRIDGELRERAQASGSGVESLALADWSVTPGERDIDITVGSGTEQAVLFAGRTVVAPTGRLVVTATDIPPPPGAAEGRNVFSSRAAGCQICHSVEPGDDGVGPTLFGVGSAAATRVEGLDASQYLRQSILLPDQYVVDGWPTGQMLPIYRERLSESELEALIAYLLTLEDDR